MGLRGVPGEVPQLGVPGGPARGPPPAGAAEGRGIGAADEEDAEAPQGGGAAHPAWGGGLKKVTRLQASAGPAVRETNWGGQVMGSLDGDDDLDVEDVVADAVAGYCEEITDLL